jgi:lysophospholipase L1-like esterase
MIAAFSCHSSRVRIVLGIVVALVLAGCSSTSSTAGPSATVAFVGDSNLLLAGAVVSPLFGRNDVVIGRSGAGIRFSDCRGESEPCPTHDYWRARLGDALRKVEPDAYVVNLGINDTVKRGTPTTPGYADYGKKIDYLMELLGNRPVFWTNLPCKVEPKRRLVGCNTVNAALAAARSRHENLTVVDWATVANTHREWMASFTGRIHHTAAGYRAWSALVAKALESRFKSK